MQITTIFAEVVLKKTENGCTLPDEIDNIIQGDIEMSEQKNQPEQVQEVKPEVIFEQRKAKIAEFEAAGLKPYGTRYDGAIPTAEAKKLYVEESETQAKVRKEIINIPEKVPF